MSGSGDRFTKTSLQPASMKVTSSSDEFLEKA
jgi:hypothetical protein